MEFFQDKTKFFPPLLKDIQFHFPSEWEQIYYSEQSIYFEYRAIASEYNDVGMKPDF